MSSPFLDSRQLRAFLVLAQEGTFTAAGKALHLTQSAVSSAIRLLEEDTGCQLFLRQGRGVLLTHHGRELLRHAEAIQRQMIQARTSLGALDRNPRGQLRIGCTPVASQFILPTVLREFKDSFPLFSILVTPGESLEVLERLETGTVDLAVCLKPTDAAKFECRPLFEDDLVFLTGALHPWRRTPPKPKSLADETFIISSRKSATFSLIEDYFSKLGVRPKSLTELGNPEAIKELVKLGLGVTIASRWEAAAQINDGTIAALPLPRGRIRRQWAAVSLKKRPISLAEFTFMGLCEEVGAQNAAQRFR